MISWNAVDFADSYFVTIFDVGRNCSVTSSTVTGTSYGLALQDGSYTVRVDSMNSPLKEAGDYMTAGTDVAFTVEKLHEHDFTGVHETVTPSTCTSTGLEKVFCSDPTCGEYVTREIPKKDHTFTTILTPATTESEGSIDKLCTFCGYTYTETVLGIPTQSDPLIKISNVTASAGSTVDVPVTFTNPSGVRHASFNFVYDSSKVQILEVISNDSAVADLFTNGDSVMFSLAGNDPDKAQLTCRIYVKSGVSGDVLLSSSYGLRSFSDDEGNYVYPALKHGTVTVKEFSAILYGDANNDGSVNLKDVLLLRRTVAGAVYDGELDPVLADVNGDKKVDMKDVLYLRRFLAGEIDQFPVQH